MEQTTSIRSIVVYLIRQHPLDGSGREPIFHALGFRGDLRRKVEDLIGEHDPDDISLLVDKHPAGPGWRVLLQALLEERVSMVITHLAPLSSAQRQQLIGICAEHGAQLITPADAGRNREREALET